MEFYFRCPYTWNYSYVWQWFVDVDGSYCAQFRLTESRRSCSRTPLSDWPKLLVPGARLCVECQPLVMSGGVGNGRCSGHGVLDRETRWSAVGVPGCRGKWIMTTRHANCRCPADNQFSFVLVWESRATIYLLQSSLENSSPILFWQKIASRFDSVPVCL